MCSIRLERGVGGNQVAVPTPQDASPCTGQSRLTRVARTTGHYYLPVGSLSWNPRMPSRASVMFHALACLVALTPALTAQKPKTNPPDAIQRQYQPVADRTIVAATADSAAWNKLAELTDGFGNRLSGSEALERAIDWLLARMKAEGLDNPHTEPVMVPHWVRGHE